MASNMILIANVFVAIFVMCQIVVAQDLDVKELTILSVPRVCRTPGCWNPCYRASCPMFAKCEPTCRPDCERCVPRFFINSLLEIPLKYCCPKTFIPAYNKCVKCIKTCPGPVISPDHPNEICFGRCIPCICPPGYVLGPYRHCIPEKECPRIIG